MSSPLVLFVVFLAWFPGQGRGVVPPSPFLTLETVPGVTFSNDRYAVSLHLPVASYVVDLPGLGLHADGPTAAGGELRIGCRASNGLPGYGVAPPQAVLELPRHPAARDAYPVLHPMFWILGLAGRGVQTTSLSVAVHGLASRVPGVLRLSSVYDLGGRPPMSLDGLPALDLLSQVALGRPLALEAEGADTFVSVRLAPAPLLAQPAAVLAAHCPSR